MKVESFLFKNYYILKDNKTLIFNYEYEVVNGENLCFKETIELPKKVSFDKFPAEMIDNIFSGLHLMLGVSYYKIFCPKKVILSKNISKNEAEFWNKVYREGLGEFYYRNDISPLNSPKFPYIKKDDKSYRLKRKRRALVGIGGGKDSMVAVEIMRDAGIDVSGFAIPQSPRTKEIIDDSISALNISSMQIKRKIDSKVINNYPGSYNGHVPISGIFAFLGILCAVLYDYEYFVVGNEQSSNFGNTEKDGVTINHQWSKSSEFESLMQWYTRNLITPDVLYFSILRPFDELRIVEIFTKYKRYFKHFTSCNRNFRQDQKQKELWCGECPKCLFIFLLFSAFLNKKEMISIFGSNFFDNKMLLPLFKDILGIGEMKPFDCVGTFDESQVAFQLAKKEFSESYIISELSKKIKVTDGQIKKVFTTSKQTLIPDYLKFAGLKNALILGYGIEGEATEKFLRQKYPNLKIDIADKVSDPKYLEKQFNYDIVVKTPGLPKSEVQVYYTTGTNIFFSYIKNYKIGVTGTKGKSTTSSLIYEIFKKAGMKVTLLGNIGSPMVNVINRNINEKEIFVIELSSYQLDDIRYSPNMSLVLNLYQDHMSYHGGIENYYKAKRNIINYQNPNDIFIYDGANKILEKWARESASKTIPVISKKDSKIYKTRLLGEHNQQNIRSAITVAKTFNISDKIISESVKRFKPLEHRLEFAGEVDGIRFYNDSISTTPESTIAAINCFDQVGSIILGGEDRGYDFTNLEKEIIKRKIKNVVLFPDSGNRMFCDNKKLNIFKTKDINKAVEFCFNNSKPNDVCLLSPASPSFSVFKNYKDRGEQFKKYVFELKK